MQIWCTTMTFAGLHLNIDAKQSLIIASKDSGVA